jgi:hypothetical protein
MQVPRVNFINFLHTFLSEDSVHSIDISLTISLKFCSIFEVTAFAPSTILPKCFCLQKYQKLPSQELLCFNYKNVGEIGPTVNYHCNFNPTFSRVKMMQYITAILG